MIRKRQNFFVILLIIFLNSAFTLEAKSYSEISENFYTISSALSDSMVIDIDGASNNNGAKVQLYNSNGTAAQVFGITKNNDNSYQIISKCSGKVLDVKEGNKKTETIVWQYESNGTDAQKWYFEPAGDGYFYIVSKLSGLYLDVSFAQCKNCTPLWVYTKNYTKAQKFKLKAYCLSDDEAKLRYDRRDYSSRLNWFEKKIAEYYSNFSTGNILITGDNKFCSNFKKVFGKYSTKFHFAAKPEEVRNSESFDLIINSRFEPEYNKYIFKNAKNISFFRDVYEEILITAVLEHFRENSIPIFFFEAPTYNKIMKLNLSDFERNLLSKWYSENDVIDNKKLLAQVYGQNIECQNFVKSKAFWESSNCVDRGNYFTAVDYKSQYCNSISGRRLTTDSPAVYQNSVYMFGPCTVRGRHVSDKYTISSFLQRSINSNFKNRYLSVNCGIENIDEINDFEYMLHTTYKPGDIVIEERDFGPVLRKVLKNTNTNYFELSSIFSRPHPYGNWVLNRVFHINHNGTQAIADYMYKIIKSRLSANFAVSKPNKIVKYDFNYAGFSASTNFFKENPDFKNYLDNLKAISKNHQEAGKKIGSLNVNCNPFTLGHRYLIEEALKKVDHLYLFVVEEDASDFSFKDRYEMIKRGVADLKNITILTTGKWMCSKFTFPDYFNKNNIQDKVIFNPTKDIELYGKYIAPALGATIRFAGEEPFYLITRQHNNFMKNKLPEYGVEFFEIPRKTLPNGQVISASTVRKYFLQENYKELEKFVPETTLNYLKEYGFSLLKT